MKQVLPCLVTSILLAASLGFADSWLELEVPLAPSARSGHSLTAVDEDLYLFGGQGDGSAAGNELYRWAGDAIGWLSVSPEGQLPPARSLHATAAYDGLLYVLQGWSFPTALDDVWAYDPGANAWSQVSPPAPRPSARSLHRAVALGDRIYLVGGVDETGTAALGDVWALTPASGSWEQRAPLPLDGAAGLYGHSLVAWNDQLWVFGGDTFTSYRNQVWRYDPVADVWHAVEIASPTPSPRALHGAACASGTLWVMGGEQPGGAGILQDAWELDLEGGQWTRRSDLPLALDGLAAAVEPSLLKGRTVRVLAFGGRTSGGSTPVPSDATLRYTSDSALPPLAGPQVALPAVARVRGSGAFFTSRLEAFNSSAQDLVMTLTYTPRSDLAGGPRSAQWTLPAGRMETVDDPLGRFFGFGDDQAAVGSLMLDATAGSTDDLVIQSVVFARLDTGEEYGQLFPAMRAEAALTAGDTAWLSTTEDAERNRVNVGIMALADATRVTVTPVDPVGTALAAGRVLELDLGGNVQLNNLHAAFGLGPVDDILVELAVTGGRAVGYASVLDGNLSYPGTSDPATILPVSSGAPLVTLLELGSVVGLDEFAGSASISNLSTRAALIAAEYHARGNPGTTATATLTLEPGDTVGFANLVSELFALQGSVGTVVLSATNQALIHASGREFALFRDEHGTVIGTAGQPMAGLTTADLVMPGRRWHVIGLKQVTVGERTERSHLAVFNPGEADATVSVRLFDGASGADQGSRSWTVRPGELLQVNSVIAEVDPDHDAADKRLEITVSAPLHLKAFRVNLWGDPITIDAYPGR